MAVRFSTFMGQPGSAMTGAWGPSRSRTLMAPVTPPFAAGMPPEQAHVPTATTASALAAASRTMSSWVRPPMQA